MRMMNGRKAGGRHCFTLVEMMLVIMIMIICASILMPILTRLPKYAQEVACINNMRQVAIGYKTYMIDNNNQFPVPVFYIDDFSPVSKYLNGLGVFSCPGSRSIDAQSEADLTPVYGKGKTYAPSKTDYYLTGTITDIERNGHANNGFGNSSYKFDPSNPQPAVTAYMALHANMKRAIYERRHCNHPTFRTVTHMTHRMNVMYIDEVQHVFNTTGMADYFVLDSKGELVWKTVTANPWWTLQPVE